MAILLLKHSVKLRRCVLCGDVAACREMSCVLFVVQTDRYALRDFRPLRYSSRDGHAEG